MSSQTSPSKDVPSADEAEVKALYRQLLERWNQRDAAAFAASTRRTVLVLVSMAAK
jgi:hypothetical protein